MVVPAPSTSSSGGDAETTSRVDGPYVSSSFCPGAGVKITSSVSSPAATSVGLRSSRCRGPSTVFAPADVSAPGASRVSRCAADSTTSTSPSPVSTRSLGSASPSATVPTCPVSGSKRRTAPLYVSAISTEPSGSAHTPSGCWSNAWSAGPSTCPKSNRP